MSESSPTVAIVGAGPAGAAAAFVAASSGLRAILLERSQLPRNKTCGEGCTPRAVQNLARMGLLDALLPLGAQVHNAFLVSPGGWELFTQLPPSVHGGRALVVPRRTLDAMLVERAVRAGAILRQNAQVEDVNVDGQRAHIRLRGGSSVHADLVIGCDGMPSVVRRSLGVRLFAPRQSAFAIRAIFDNVRLPHADALTIVWDRDVLPAYGWVFPLPDGRANVGIGLRTDKLRASCHNLTQLMDGFLAMPRIRRVLQGARMLSKPQGHALPMTCAWGSFAFDRAMLAGDAAGFVNPLTGEGIEYALESGELAGLCAIEAANRGDFRRAVLSSVYEKACRTRFGATMRLNGLLRWLFSMPWLLDRVFRAGARSKDVCDDIARIALGGDDARITPRMLAAAILG